jgi:DnaJ-class molecular chaperone
MSHQYSTIGYLMIPKTRCPDCEGDGEVEVDTFHPASASNSYGYESSSFEICETCNGDGEFTDD